MENKEPIVIHHCTQEATIGEMFGLLKRMTHQIYGNGQKGLAITVPELSVKIDNLVETTRLLSTNVSALAKFQAERTGDIRTEDKVKLSSRQWTQIALVSIIGTSSIVVTLLIEFLK
jgi:hypothetical protein